MSWLVGWYEDQVWLDGETLRKRTSTDGYPAYPWLPDGTPLELGGDGGARAPWHISFVVSSLVRYPPLFNLDELRRGVHLALAGTPDTRTPQQKTKDAWAAYQAAKVKYERP
jgi:hypothetical protein